MRVAMRVDCGNECEMLKMLKSTERVNLLNGDFGALYIDQVLTTVVSTISTKC
jgi:hypothetical protein